MTSSVVVVGISVAKADVPCAPRSNSKAFARWGDNNNYFRAPGGTFEYSTSAGVDDSWAETWDIYSIDRIAPSTRTSQDDPWDVAGPGTKSLSVRPGKAFVSPTFCVASDEESIRFVAKGASGQQITVRVLVQSDRGWEGVDHVITGTGKWEVSPQLPIPNLRDANGEQWVNIKFGSATGTLPFLVDNVMVDPWRSL
jgi:hypothetical protein